MKTILHKALTERATTAVQHYMMRTGFSKTIRYDATLEEDTVKGCRLKVDIGDDVSYITLSDNSGLELTKQVSTSTLTGRQLRENISFLIEQYKTTTGGVDANVQRIESIRMAVLMAGDDRFLKDFSNEPYALARGCLCHLILQEPQKVRDKFSAVIGGDAKDLERDGLFFTNLLKNGHADAAALCEKAMELMVRSST